MRWQKILVALVVAYGMIPGGGEFVENVVHLALNGHTAHEFDDEDHERQGTEHGCSGTAHLCSCCQAPLFVPAAAPWMMVLRLPRRRAPVLRTALMPEGQFPGVFRPPIA